MKYQKTTGAILLFSLMMMSVITFLTQQLMRAVTVGMIFDHTMVARQRAELLALSGVHIAMGLLAKDPTVSKKAREFAQEEKKQEAKDSDAETKKFLKKILPIINRFKEYKLTEKNDGIDGTIKICIQCEEGKLPLKQLFDFKTKAFKPEFQPLLNTLRMDDKPAISFLTEFFKKREKNVDDLSELLHIPEFAKVDLFYDPPIPVIKKSQSNEPPPYRRVALFDLFSLEGEHIGLQPLLFSDSMCAIFGCQRPQADDEKRKKEQFKEICKNYKKSWGSNWVQNWDLLKPIYGQKDPLHPEFAKLFTQEFEPKLFSVISWGIVDGVCQKLLAFIKKIPATKEGEIKIGNNDDKADSDDEKPRDEFKIVKVYWL